MSENKPTRTRKQKLTRRAFMITGGLLGGGLVVGAGGLVYMNKKIKAYTGEGFDSNMVNAWVGITTDNRVRIAVPRSEMGQGTNTALPMLVAEELEVDMSQVEIVQPQPESPYANTTAVVSKPRDIYGTMEFMEKVAAFLPVVATGGSTSIIDAYDVMRMAGATAREALVQAAAKKWGVDKSTLTAAQGKVINPANNESLTYGELAEDAATIKIAELPKLKDRKDFRIIGKPMARLDIPEKTDGSAIFGLDIRREGMLYAAMRHATYQGGSISAINNEARIMEMAGVKKVLLLPEGVGAVVVADNSWRAMNAAKALDFTESGNSTLSSVEIANMATQLLANDEMIATPVNEGDTASVFGKSDKVLEATYEVPYLAHACMEPMNCTVLVEGDKAEAWAGSQGSSLVMNTINKVIGIPKENIRVNIPYLGGGFGRRAEVDFIAHASFVAQQMEGTPIQLVYSREEDIRYEMYRPYCQSQFRAVVSKDGQIEAWENRLAVQSVANNSINRIEPAFAPPPEEDPTTIEGAAHLPYDMQNTKVAFGQLELPVPVGNWRSVGSSFNGFFSESFMDECAHAAGQDPYLFRKNKLKNHPRFEAVLDKVAAISNWGQPLAEGKFRGISLQKSFGSIVAEVAEVTKVGDKEFSIDNFYCVIDCGRVVNPDTVEAQMQSGMVYGLTAAMYGEITFNEGEVEQYNFPQYEMMRLSTVPNFVVHIMDVDAYPGGVGEPGLPPAASALANALFAATGERVRSLPFKNAGYRFV